MGQSGNIPVKSNIPKSNFDNDFDIRKSNRLHIHNVRKIHLLGFSIQRLWDKSLKILGVFFIGSLFQKYDWWVLNPLFHFELKYILS